MSQKAWLYCFIYCISSIALVFNISHIESYPSTLALTIPISFAMFGLWKQNIKPKWLLILILFSVGIKIGYMQFPVNGDLFRYLWEGKIQLYGFNPYTISPDSPELQHLRDSIWGRVNHKDFSAIYWPLAQIIFKGMYHLFGTVLSYKILFLVLDTAIVFLLYKILKHHKRPLFHLLLYVLNPFVGIYIIGEAHLEIIPLFFLILSYYLYLKHYWVWMYIAIGCAIMIKAPFLIALPFFITRKNFIHLPFICIPLYSMFMYVNTPQELLFTLTRFSSTLSYNGLLHSFLSLFLNKSIATLFCYPIALSLYGLIFFTSPKLSRALFSAMLVFIFCAPTFHPWYLFMVTPFLVLHPSRPILLFHLTVIPLVFRYNDLVHGSFWHNELLLQLLEYIPVLILLWTTLKKQPYEPHAGLKRCKVSVVIPTLNEEKNIARCIESIVQQNVAAEIIVADGGSVDKTRSIVRKYPEVSVVIAERGRGNQIIAGIEEAHTNAIAIVHADSVLLDGSLNTIVSTLNNAPSVYGGALGAVYDDQSSRFQFTRLLNDFRARILGISFGDQVQFFRTAYIKAHLRPFKLMEDIEIALLIKEQGNSAFIPSGVQCSTRTWKQHGYFENFKTVIYLTGLFLIKRKFNVLSENCYEFYNHYYNKRKTKGTK